MNGFNEYYDHHLRGAWMAVEIARAGARELGLQLSESERCSNIYKRSGQMRAKALDAESMEE